MLARRALLAGLTCAGATATIRPRAARAVGSILFQQPSYFDGIAPHFSVTGVVPQFNPVGAFYLHANQPNPFAADKNYVPVIWDPGIFTGLHVSPMRSNWQRGIFLPAQNSARLQTAAQIEGPVVAAYLNSADLINGAPGNRMMIAPEYNFPTPAAPFAAPGSAVGVALDLQVPTATDLHLNGLSNTYVKLDLVFVCAVTGSRLSFSCALFGNASKPSGDGVGYDDLTFTTIVSALVSPLGRLVSLEPGTALFQSAPWTGWADFSVVISQAQFARGLRAAAPVARAFGDTLSLNPADYLLIETHLNAELHFTPATPATLGWSMQNLTIAQLS